jgi:hypothetical protein
MTSDAPVEGIEEFLKRNLSFRFGFEPMFLTSFDVAIVQGNLSRQPFGFNVGVGIIRAS